MVDSQVPDTSQIIRWPDTALPVIGMVHHESTTLSLSGSYRVLRGRRVREECRAKPLLTPLGVPPGIALSVAAQRRPARRATAMEGGGGVRSKIEARKIGAAYS